jgi:hypothetical protein
MFGYDVGISDKHKYYKAKLKQFYPRSSLTPAVRPADQKDFAIL